MPAPPKPAKRPKKAPKPIPRAKKPISRGSRPARVRRTAAGKAKHAADLAWAKQVRAKGPCAAIGYQIPYRIETITVEALGTTQTRTVTYYGQHECQGQMEAAHIMRRGYAATRTDLDNGLPLCHGVHAWFTAHPDEWIAFAKFRIGEAKYEELRIKALEGRS